MTLPLFQSQLSMQTAPNNFVAIQSASLAVTAASDEIVFTAVPGTGRVTAKISNRGEAGCYLASGTGSATAVVATSTPQPAASANPVISNCDYIEAGAIMVLDFIAGTDTFAAICDTDESTILEISVGYGQ